MPISSRNVESTKDETHLSSIEAGPAGSEPWVDSTPMQCLRKFYDILFLDDRARWVVEAVYL
jgi:hypothetical protein